MLRIIFFVFLIWPVGQVLSQGLNRKFEAYWSVPSEQCGRLKGNSSEWTAPSRFGIHTNQGEKFYGAETVLFYEKDLGLYPSLEGSKTAKGFTITKVENGGIPQLVDLVRHLKKAKADILRAIPEANFSGLAVIDYENWRPLYSTNWGLKRIIQMASIEEARLRYGNISEHKLKVLAEHDFNEHSILFLTSTLRLGKHLRPHAYWGYYDFPLCNLQHDEVENEPMCNPKITKYTKGLLSLYNEMDAFYPSIYLHNSSMGAEEERQFIRARLAEVNRLQKRLGRERAPIYAFSKIEYDPYIDDVEQIQFYSNATLCNVLDYPALLGVNGVVFWSTSKSMKQRCASISRYLERNLGPRIPRLKQKIKKCNWKKCGNQGRCVLKSPDTPFDCPSGGTKGGLHDTHAYKCRCDKNHFGPRCEATLGVQKEGILGHRNKEKWGKSRIALNVSKSG